MKTRFSLSFTKIIKRQVAKVIFVFNRLGTNASFRQHVSLVKKRTFPNFFLFKDRTTQMQTTEAVVLLLQSVSKLGLFFLHQLDQVDEGSV